MYKIHIHKHDTSMFFSQTKKVPLDFLLVSQDKLIFQKKTLKKTSTLNIYSFQYTLGYTNKFLQNVPRYVRRKWYKFCYSWKHI